VNYPGVAPEVMEQQVTLVLEQNLAATEGLVTIDSRASQGRTNVNLLFEYGTNLDLALQDAARHLELARTQLPPDIEPPRLYKFDASQDPVWQAGFSSTVRSEAEVRDWVENRLVPQLIAIHGVSGVEAAGGQEREVEISAKVPRASSARIRTAWCASTATSTRRWRTSAPSWLRSTGVWRGWSCPSSTA